MWPLDVQLKSLGRSEEHGGRWLAVVAIENPWYRRLLGSELYEWRAFFGGDLVWRDADTHATPPLWLSARLAELFEREMGSRRYLETAPGLRHGPVPGPLLLDW